MRITLGDGREENALVSDYVAEMPVVRALVQGKDGRGSLRPSPSVIRIRCALLILMPVPPKRICIPIIAC